MRILLAHGIRIEKHPLTKEDIFLILIRIFMKLCLPKKSDLDSRPKISFNADAQWCVADRKICFCFLVTQSNHYNFLGI